MRRFWTWSSNHSLHTRHGSMRIVSNPAHLARYHSYDLLKGTGTRFNYVAVIPGPNILRSIARLQYFLADALTFIPIPFFFCPWYLEFVPEFYELFLDHYSCGCKSNIFRSLSSSCRSSLLSPELLSSLYELLKLESPRHWPSGLSYFLDLLIIEACSLWRSYCDLLHLNVERKNRRLFPSFKNIDFHFCIKMFSTSPQTPSSILPPYFLRHFWKYCLTCRHIINCKVRNDGLGKYLSRLPTGFRLAGSRWWWEAWKKEDMWKPTSICVGYGFKCIVLHFGLLVPAYIYRILEAREISGLWEKPWYYLL